MPTSSSHGNYYKPIFGLIFIFNIIVGNGALTMPKAFSISGWLMGSLFLIIICFFSYITFTFNVEAMCNAAILKRQKIIKSISQSEFVESSNADNTPEDQLLIDDETVDVLRETSPAPHDNELFDTNNVIELGEMASMFFNKIGYNLFYISMCIYLYGDLAIYLVVIPTSLRNVTCMFYKNETLLNETYQCSPLEDSDPCWFSSVLTRSQVYRIYVVCFVCTLGLFAYFQLQKTKYLQLTTSLIRWISFITMISLAVKTLTIGKGQGHPPIFKIQYLPNLFGVCVYAFMCHHSIPQMITPIKPKNNLFTYVTIDYLLILSFYLLLSITGIYCFSDLHDLYTLNFKMERCGPEEVSFLLAVEYFLALFPVFTLSTNFPVVAITLSNNLRKLFNNIRDQIFDATSIIHRICVPFVDRIFFPTLALIVPLVIALSTDNIGLLVGITGSYAGVCIQYLIPSALVFYSRRVFVDEYVNDMGAVIAADSMIVALPNENHLTSRLTSPFKNNLWIYLIFFWSVTCMVAVTIDIVYNFRF